ncbi:DUF5916 domain-containing protein [Myxococcaceae bacterium GXIMD 01537]
MLRQSLAVTVALYAGSVWAASEGPGRTQFIQAARAPGPITVDGKLDEDAWAQAPVFTDFVQRFPHAGAPPTQRTELRVLYDSGAVYVGVFAQDPQPEQVDRRLARRDSDPFSDAIVVMLDPTHDHRTGYTFILTAGGVQSDGLYYDDTSYTPDWDAVWAGVAGAREDGWVAEFAIPLSQLRFPAAPVQTWGFGVRRQVARSNEEFSSVDNPRTSGAMVSRLGHLTGLTDLSPRGALELVPYVATRGLLRPQFSDAARPTPRLLDPTVDVGVDLKAALSSDLALTATFNPDFGQVEADQLLLNLSTFETFFPEKRAFFTQGMELFQAPGADTPGGVPQRLFYSRRIGLGTPILGAAKLTGTVAPGVEIGVMDALVTGPWQRQDEENPDRAVELHASRPLHLGPNTALPGDPLATTNFLTAVMRASVGPNSRVGGAFASAVPLTRLCTPEAAALDEDEQPAECLARGGLGGAVDFNLRTADSQYGVLGQVDGSKTLGGLPERTLADGTVLARGASGLGGYLRAGKLGGEGLRWDVGYDYASPTLDLNATGFMRSQNEHTPRLRLRYVRPNGMGPFRSFYANAYAGGRWSSDGRGVSRGNWVSADVSAQFSTFDTLGVEMGTDGGGWDIRELDGTGVPLEAGRNVWMALFGDTNGNRPVSAGGFVVAAHHLTLGPTPPRWGWGANLNVSVRPHPALETRLEVNTDRTPFGPRFVENLGDHHFVLGTLDSNMLSLTLRQQWVLSPHLTLQGYAQLFSAYGLYGPFFTGASDARRTPLRMDSLTPTQYVDDSSFYDVALNVNVVLRWEYRLGSTLFFVYSRSQQGLPTPDGTRPPATVLPQGLLAGPANDAVLLKWSYYWSA